MVRRFSILLLLALPVAGTVGASADTIRLKNGRSLEGLIEEETDLFVVLDVGVGTVKLPRSGIEAVQRSDVIGAEQIRRQWQAHYFSHPRYVPAGYEDVAAAFKNLQGSQQAAALAFTRVRQRRRDQAGRQAEIKNLSRELAEVDDRLAGLTTESDPQAYHELTVRHNNGVARLSQTRNEIDRQEDQNRTELRVMSDYLQSYPAFESFYSNRWVQYRNSMTNEQGDTFFQSIGNDLKSLARDFELETLQAVDEPGHLVVEAILNSQVKARLILDTGATTVTISQWLADRLHLDRTGRDRLDVRLADGSVIQAEPVTLDSVRVGSAQVDHVPAVVIPYPADHDVDGLLGMTFLREFVIQYDASRQKLVLMRYHPQ